MDTGVVTTAPASALVARGLSRRLGRGAASVLATDGIELDVRAGEVFGLLGPNGAGKTTLVRQLVGLLRPDAGSVTVLGHPVWGDGADPGVAARAVAYLAQEEPALDELPVALAVQTTARLRGLSRSDAARATAALVEELGLSAYAARPLVQLSGGQRRLACVATALAGDRPVLVLDEPTTGLDPRSRHTMWDIIRDLVADGVTIFLTTQYLEEADQLADRIAVLDGGKVVAEGTADELKRLIPSGHIRLQFADPRGLESAAHALGEVSRNDHTLTLQVPSDGGVRSLKAVLDRLDDQSIAVDGLSIHTPDLDDVFFALTGHPSKEQESVR